MPESIIVPVVDRNYDLAHLSPFQSALVPYEVWWELFLWGLFGLILFYKLYHYLILPYLDESN
jgi:hypothetical protein